VDTSLGGLAGKPGGYSFREQKAGWILEDKKTSRLNNEGAVA
jgi:hypothetical protein